MAFEILNKIRRGVGRVWRPRVVHEKRAIGMLSVCFDDFPKSAWTVGGGVLRDHGVHATYYVSGALAGTVFCGNEMFDAADLEAIDAEGHEIGCHTHDHRSCLSRGVRAFERSLDANERYVRERVANLRMVSFAYPYGDASPRTKSAAARRFVTARGVDAGLNRGRLDVGQLKAVGLEDSKMRIGAVERWVEEAAAVRAWLIVFTHDVSDKPSSFGCRSQDLDRLLRTAKGAGLEILPVKSALAARA
jgi:peptidoglycan/xylan/chitin deacetylase (PgdA/CDA1 family)